MSPPAYTDISVYVIILMFLLVFIDRYNVLFLLLNWEIVVRAAHYAARGGYSSKCKVWCWSL